MPVGPRRGMGMSRVRGCMIHPYSKAVIEKLTSLLFLVLSFYCSCVVSLSFFHAPPAAM